MLSTVQTWRHGGCCHHVQAPPDLFCYATRPPSETASNGSLGGETVLAVLICGLCTAASEEGAAETGRTFEAETGVTTGDGGDVAVSLDLEGAG